MRKVFYRLKIYSAVNEGNLITFVNDWFSDSKRIKNMYEKCKNSKTETEKDLNYQKLYLTMGKILKDEIDKNKDKMKKVSKEEKENLKKENASLLKFSKDIVEINERGKFLIFNL